VADEVQNTGHAERPRAQRYHFVASVELVDLQSELQFKGRAMDLSLYGCGVALSKSIPAGTKLRIKIANKGKTFSAFAKVAYVTAEGEMGIVFVRIEPRNQMILEDWINELRDR
jgi:hypothetical protein